MAWVFHCECGTDVTGENEDEFVATVIDYAKTRHGVTLTKEQVLALAVVE